MWGDDEPWVSIADMNQGLIINWTKERLSAAGAAKGKLVLPGTVLLSFKLSIGKVARAAMPLYTNEAIAALPIKDPTSVDATYLMRALQAQDLSSGSNRAAMGATLNKASLRSIRIPLPSLEEQRRIAAILDKADAIRTKRRQILAHVIGLPLSLFRSYKKETWPLVPLSELMLDHQIGLDRKASAQGPDREHEYVKMDAITRDGDLQLDSITRIDATPAEVEKFSLTEGDLILNTRNSRELVGKSAVYRGPSRVYNNNIMRIRFREQATALVVHAYLWTREGRQELEQIKSGTRTYLRFMLKICWS